MMQPDWDSTVDDGDPARGSPAHLPRIPRSRRRWVSPRAKNGGIGDDHLVGDRRRTRPDAGVIVSGTRGNSGLRGLLSSSTADAVLKNAGRPVLIVPPPK